MSLQLLQPPHAAPAGSALRVYLLGLVEFERALALQQVLLAQVAGDRRAGALVLCEHPPLITVGRHGTPAHIRCGPEELRARRWRVRWVNRGGGCLLHLPGQLAVYPILPLDALGLGVEAYLARLQRVLLGVLDDFGVQGATRREQPGVWAGGRPVAAVGVAVRDWVAYFGAALNVDCDLTPFKLVQTSPGEGPMTSLVRERRGAVRPAGVRQALVERFAEAFPYFERTDLFFGHPSLGVGRG
jgi:lipoyl(octanoyl) transferase